MMDNSTHRRPKGGDRGNGGGGWQGSVTTTDLKADDSYLHCLWLRTPSCVYLSALPSPILPHPPPRPETASSYLTSFPVCILSRLSPQHPRQYPSYHYPVFGTFLFWGFNTQSSDALMLGVCVCREYRGGAASEGGGQLLRPATPPPPLPQGSVPPYLLLVTASQQETGTGPSASSNKKASKTLTRFF